MSKSSDSIAVQLSFDLDSGRKLFLGNFNQIVENINRRFSFVHVPLNFTILYFQLRYVRVPLFGVMARICRKLPWGLVEKKVFAFVVGWRCDEFPPESSRHNLRVDRRRKLLIETTLQEF